MQVLEIRKPEELNAVEYAEFLKMDPYAIRASIVDAFNWGARQNREVWVHVAYLDGVELRDLRFNVVATFHKGDSRYIMSGAGFTVNVEELLDYYENLFTDLSR